MASHLKELVKRVLPQKVLSFLSDCRDIGPAGQWIYLKLRISRAVRRRGKEWRNTAAGIRSVLFVCSGNIIRSPMAAALLRQFLPHQNRAKISVTSAGLHAVPGGSADPRALIVAREFGVSLDDHCTQRLSADSVARADIVLAMDYRNEAELLARFPQFKGKIALLGDYRDPESAAEGEIEDPYTGDIDGVQRSFRMIQSCARRLALLLNSNTASRSDLTGEAGPK
jgi:protein-tyrosine-phosphatase